MERHRQVAAFWNWLPGFRAVAETEHLPTAAERVHLTPAALSRTVRLLERELGRPLFHRRGRRLHLNEDGSALLAATRLAMRIVHDAGASMGGTQLEGPVRVAAGGVGQVFTLRAVLLARQQLPGMRPEMLTPDPSQVVEQLLRGDLDLVVGSFVLRAPGIRTELLDYASSSVYCGPASALYGRADVSLEELVTHPFTTPPPGENGISTDGWPAEIDRDVHLVVDRMAAGVQVCGGTSLLAVLPDAIATTSPVPLHRLPAANSIPKTPVVAMRREPTGAEGLAEHLVEVLRRVCA